MSVNETSPLLGGRGTRASDHNGPISAAYLAPHNHFDSKRDLVLPPTEKASAIQCSDTDNVITTEESLSISRSSDSLDEGTAPKHEPGGAEDRGSYSLLRARIVTQLAATMYFTGFICSTTLMPQYMVQRLSDDAGQVVSNVSDSPCVVTNNSNTTQADAIQAEASRQILYFTLSASGPILVTCLVAGGYSDIFGRRPPPPLFGMFTAVCKLILTSLIIKLNLPTWWFYVGYVADGLSGSWTMLFIMFISSIADTNPEKKDRAFWVAVLESSVSIVSAIFLVLTGIIIDAIGFFAASLIGVATNSTALLLALFFFPETLPPKRSGETRKFEFSIGVRRVVHYFLTGKSMRERLTLWTCLAIFMFSVVSPLSLLTIDSLYLLHRPFCWSHFHIGLYSGARMAVAYGIGIALLRASRSCCQAETLAMIGLCFMAAALCVQAEATLSWQLFLVPILSSPSSIVVPVIRTILSFLASSSDQGALNSSVAVVEVIINQAGVTGVLSVYSATLAGPVPGAVYFLLASFTFLAFLLYFVYFKLRIPVRTDHERLVK